MGIIFLRSKMEMRMCDTFVVLVFQNKSHYLKKKATIYRPVRPLDWAARAKSLPIDHHQLVFFSLTCKTYPASNESFRHTFVCLDMTENSQVEA